jgi:acylphosphatase
MKRVVMTVSGTVQGVGYRQTCRAVARSLGLVGSVRNLADGGVEIVAQGEDHRVDQFRDWAWTGPSGAKVTGVETESVAVDPYLADFFIQPSEAKSR